MQLQIYATVFCEKVHAVVFFKVVQQLTVGKVGNSNVLAVPARRAGRKAASPRHADTRLRRARLCRDTRTRGFAPRGFAATHRRGHTNACTYLPRLLLLLLLLLNEYYLHAVKQKSCKSMLQVD